MKSRTIPLALAALLAGATAAAAATATLHDTDGNAVGMVTLTEGPNGVLVDADLTGLPAGTHGFHIHQTGACTPDFGASGGHFAGGAAAHGFMTEGGPHAGDMPNIHVPENGSLQVEVFAPGLTFHDGAGALFDDDGAAILIHAGFDDYASAPSGDAGARIACGVIEE